MPKAQPRTLNLEPIPAPPRVATVSRPVWWRGAALVASFAVHGIAIAALQFWPGRFARSGSASDAEALTVAFRAPADEPQQTSEPDPKPVPPPKPEPARVIPESQPPEPEPIELPVILVVMNAPPLPELRFQPAVELIDPSIDFPKPKEASKPAKTPAPPASSQRSKPATETVAARPTRTPSPVYPSSAVAGKLEGTVVFTLTIGVSGKVDAVQLVRSSGHPVLDGAGEQGVRRWRFSPATRDGVRVVSKLTAPVEFRLR